MTDSSVRVPEISQRHDGREIECSTVTKNGIVYYRQSTVAMAYVHQRVHDGRFFSGGYFNSAVANNSTIDLLLQTSATLATHIQFSGASGGDSTIQLFEDATFSDAGTVITMSNHNRASDKTMDATVTHTPTILTTGAHVNGTVFVPGGQKAQSGGGSGGFDDEFVLKLSSTYLVRFTNISGQTKPMFLLAAGYQPEL